MLLLCRSMAWVWNASIQAWTTQVTLSGEFVLIREVREDGVLVSLILQGPMVVTASVPAQQVEPYCHGGKVHNRPALMHAFQLAAEQTYWHCQGLATRLLDGS